MTDEINPEISNSNETPKGEPIKNDEDTNGKGATKFYREQFNSVKSQLDQIQAEKEQLARKLSEIEEKKMIEQNQFKELADRYKTEVTKTKEEYDQFKGYFIKEKKYSAIQQEALKLGIREEALNDLSLLDNSQVEIETTSSGKVNVLGAKEFVENLKTIRPFWFKNQTAPRLDTTSPQFDGMPRKLSGQELLDLSRKDYVAYSKYINDQRKK